MNREVPVLRFPEFSGEWAVRKLSSFIESLDAGVSVNSIDRKAKSNEKGILKTSSVSFDVFKTEENKAVIENIEIQRLKEPVQGNTIIISRMNTPALVGANAIVYQDMPNIFLPDRLWSAKINPDYSVFWLGKLMSSKKFRTLLSSRATGTSASMKNITKTDVLSLLIASPLLREQQKIANFLTQIDRKIELLTKKKQLLECYKKGVMQQLFSQKLRFKDDNGNAYPDWEVKKLGDFKNLIHGDGDWILSKDISKKGMYKIVQLGSIGVGKYIYKNLKTISKDKFKELKGTQIKKGDLLINRMVDKNINSCIFPCNGDFITSVDVCWVRENSYFNNYFFMALINVEISQNKLLSLSSGSGRVRISKKNLFEKFKFLLPSLEEQTKIANFLSEIDNKINQVEEQLNGTKDYKKGLLQQMFV
ncbi:MAG: restriction endonuclease subunit S [Methylococcales bacterium]|nr:restriction endonuclease subunit S [Methylococcales bacterium]